MVQNEECEYNSTCICIQIKYKFILNNIRINILFNVDLHNVQYEFAFIEK